MSRSHIHDIFPELSPRAEIYEKINLIEKNWLDQAQVLFPEHVQTALEEFQCVRLLGGQATFDSQTSQLFAKGLLPHVLEALHGQQHPLMYVMKCRQGALQVHMGTHNSGVDTLRGLMESSVGPDLLQDSGPACDLKGDLFCAAMTGIPRKKDVLGPQGRDGKQQDMYGLQKLITSLIPEDFVYLVLAYPISRQQTGQWFECCAREIQDIKESFLLREMQKHNKMAVHYTDILEKSFKRLRQGKQCGLWQTGIYLFSSYRNTVTKGASVLQALLADAKPQPESIRAHICSRQQGISPQINCLTSRELELPVSLPEREYPGFCLRELVAFDLDQTTSSAPGLSLGRLTDHDYRHDQKWQVPVDDLSKHGLVAGLTGSGKTNTVFHLLRQLHQGHGKPFMVIEPAKSEYRNLLRHIPGLKVFTLGEERLNRSAPFRWNPFAFHPGISLQTHLDLLKAVFQASFVMYAPMPYILEECLYKIYEDKGWNLVTSVNPRGFSDLAFPTLHDLYKKVDQVVDRIGYDHRLTMDIKSALKTRIKNLCLGGKGQMLNTRGAIPWSELMTQPVVLELKYLGSDEDKAFMMGLILMAIWEHYEGQSENTQGQGHGLKHLAVIEEAHRLLKHVPTEKTSEEMSNVKGKGVESFCHLFAEIRAYGQGFLVSEQIPGKLAPDVIKNSNLKIMHRTVAKDDREVMGESMNLNRQQQRFAVSLNTGRAICFQEGMDRPSSVQIPLAAGKEAEVGVTSQEISAAMHNSFFSLHPQILDRFYACRLCPDRNTERCAQIRQEVENERSDPNWEWNLVRLFLPCVLFPTWEEMQEHLHTIFEISGTNLSCYLAHAIFDFIMAKGDFEHWNYGQMEEAITRSQAEINSGGWSLKLGEYCTANEAPKGNSCAKFCSLTGCPCAYEVSILSQDPVLHNQLTDLLHSPEYGPRFYQELIILLVDTLRDLLPESFGSSLQGLARCLLVQTFRNHRISLRLQREILESFAKYFPKTVQV